MYTFILVIHTIIAVAIVGFVLIQRSESDGFGLSGGGNSLMSGQAKANFLTRTTGMLAGAFMLTSLILTVMVNNREEKSIIDSIPQNLPAAAAPAATPDAAPAAADAAAPVSETQPATQPEKPKVPLAE